jgi:hypothetical protein
LRASSIAAGASVESTMLKVDTRNRGAIKIFKIIQLGINDVFFEISP